MSGSVQFYLAIIVFLLTYVGIMSEKLPRTICALFGGGAMIYLGLVTQEEAITEFIDFNTLGLLAGMMILISVVKKSGFFQVLALWALKKIQRTSPGTFSFAFYCYSDWRSAYRLCYGGVTYCAYDDFPLSYASYVTGTYFDFRNIDV